MLDLNRLLLRRHLDEEEELTVVVHKHWLIGIKVLFWPVCSLVLLWAAFALFPNRSMFYLASFLSVVTLVWMLRNFFDYYLDAWLITDQGVIDVEWHGWFHRESTRILFSDIQGVGYEINGVVATVFRYGSVSVEKISTGSAISMEYVFKPWRVETVILRNMEAYLHTKNMKDAKHVQKILAGLVAQNVQLEEMTDDDSDDDA